MTRFGAVGVVFALAGCMPSTHGIHVRPEQLSAFQVGVTTEADVIGVLGAPMMKTANSDGTRGLVYGFANVQEGRSQGTTLLFGADGKLKSHHQTEADYASGRGRSSPPPEKQ